MFDSFNARVDGLNPRIEALQSQVDVAMGRQRAFLQSIAVEELRSIAEIFERLLADNVEPEIRDRTWFFLAKIWHQRGYLAIVRKFLLLSG